MKNLLGIIGRKGSGKDTLGLMVSSYFPFAKRLAFFDPGKQELATLFGGDLKTIEENKANPKMRKLLQFYGTEVCRAEDINYWVEKFNKTYNETNGPTTLVYCTDCRFENEAAAVKNLGGLLVRVFRPSVDNSSDTHTSETELERIKWDFSVNNDASLGRLQWYAKILARQLKERWGI